MNRDEFAAAVDGAFSRMMIPLKNFAREQIESPLAEGKWSLKDLAAHFIFWDLITVRALEANFRGDAFDWNAYSDWNALNAKAVEESKSSPHARVAAEWLITHTTVIEALRRLPDETLLVDGTIPQWLHENVLDHYEYHASQVDDWVAALKHAGKLGPSELSVLN